MEKQLIINRLRSARRTARFLGERVNQSDSDGGVRELEQDLAEIETEI
jgi:hypothetical protein